MNRREFVSRTGTLAFGAAALRSPLISAPAQPDQPYSQALPDMLATYFAAALNGWSAEWDRKRQQIKTPAGLEERNAFVRRKSIEMIGGLPERTPLQARTVKILERSGYRIENVMFQSRPDFWVTGNLYVPAPGGRRLPAIISPCGHYPLARMVPQYQFAYQSLVKSGFVVFAYDPIGQGERRQYWNPYNNVTEVGGPVVEHSMPGQLLLLLGESLSQYRIWDGIRAIDYLLTRPEVDPEGIGCAGHSGGGTLTLFISALDERVRCAVVHEGGTANRWPMHVEPFSALGISDIEQNLFPGAIYGVDNVDLHIAIAPRPLLTTVEHLSVAFADATDRIRAGYRQLGAAEKFAAVQSDDPHAWTFKLRLATADWFSRWFYGRPGPASEPELTAERTEELYCTPNGSIRYSQQGDTIWSRILKKQATLPPKIELPADAKQVESYCGLMRVRIRELLRLQTVDQPLSPRPIANVSRKGCRIEKVEFLSEPGIYIPAWIFVPEKIRPGSMTILYFSEAGKDADGMEFEGEEASGLKLGVLEQLARRGNTVVAADVRGIGETRPEHAGEAEGEFGHLFDADTALSYMAWYLHQSLLGMRVRDVLRTVDYALGRPDANPQGVHVIGKEMGALWVLYAAALDQRILAVICEKGLLSYRSLTGTDRYLHEASVFIPDVLEQFDLTHVAAAIAGRRVALLSPVDAMKQRVDIPTARESHRWAETVFANAGAARQFQIAGYEPEQELAGQYLSLLDGEAGL